MAFIDVETIEDCIDAATVDCYGEDELACGWQVCLDEILGNTAAMVLGDRMQLTSIDLSGSQVIAICKKGKGEIKVALDSIELIAPTAVQQLWLDAWIGWSKG